MTKEEKDLLDEYKGRENTPLGRSLAAMERVYAFLVGLALTNAARRLFDIYVEPGAATHPPFLALDTLSAFSAFFAIAVTLVPFYQGAHVHLDTHYRYYENEKPKTLLKEVPLILISSFVFFMCGELVHMPFYFGWAFLVIFIVDLAWAKGWGVPPRLRAHDHKRGAGSTIESWVVINSWTGTLSLVVVAGFWVWERLTNATALDSHPWNAEWEPYRLLPVFLCVIAVARTCVDYGMHHQIYFGDGLDSWRRGTSPAQPEFARHSYTFNLLGATLSLPGIRLGFRQAEAEPAASAGSNPAGAPAPAPDIVV